MSEPAISQDKLAFRIDEAVKATGLGRTFLYERIASGDLPSIKVGTRRLILRQELMNFLLRSSETTSNGSLGPAKHLPKRSGTSDVPSRDQSNWSSPIQSRT
jgi:excisionase family DNA binding protein